MLITVDWLAFRVRELPENNIFGFLGLDDLDWRVGGNVYNNYPDSLRYGHITIGINGTAGYDFYVCLSGQGCREFEDLMPDGWKWEKLLFKLADSDLVSFSRFDIAGDEREGYFNIKRLDKAVGSHKYQTKCKIPTIQKYGREICYVGSSHSNVLMRIYNKKMERGYSPEDDDGRPWWRCELQLRDDYCRQMIFDIREHGIGQAYSGHCLNHIRWLTKPNDLKNSQRINTATWYKKFLGSCEKLKFTSAPGAEYNLSKLHRYLHKQVGSSLITYQKATGLSPQELWTTFEEDESIVLRQDQLDFIKKFQKTDFGKPVDDEKLTDDELDIYLMNLRADNGLPM